MTAHNIPIWKFLIILNKMVDEGYNNMDITIHDDLEISVRGIRFIEDEKKDENPDIDWEETI